MRKLTTFEFIEKAKKIHNNKYDYSKTEYIKSKIKICIICHIHGEFWQTPNTHLLGAGCPDCAGTKRSNISSFIEKAKFLHNNKYDYSKVNYVNAHTKIIITCPIHGDFLQTPNKHLKNHNCPKCNISKGELRIRNWLTINNIQFEEQKTFKNCINPNTNYKLRYDFYLPEHNLLIEFDGIQHFRPSTFNGKIDKEQTLKLFEQTKFTDNIKNNYARENNIRLLRIPYTKFSSINKIISSYLNQLDQT